MKDSECSICPIALFLMFAMLGLGLYLAGWVFDTWISLFTGKEFAKFPLHILGWLIITQAFLVLIIKLGALNETK